MEHFFKKTILASSALSLMLMAFAPLNTATASPRNDEKKYSSSHHQKQSRDSNHDRARDRDRHERRDYRERDHNDNHVSVQWRGNRPYHGYRGHVNNGSNIVLGVGLGLLTYGLLNNHHDHYRQPERVVYVPQPERVVYVPQPQRVVYVAQQNQAPQNNCLQTREYQTTVIIGNVERDAYGTSCLQPDGSWLQSAPIIAPD